MTLKLRQCLLIFTVFLVANASYGQFGFSHEVGVIAGPVQFRSDFGQRLNEENNFGNTGYGIGLIHYINFSYRADCNCYTADNYFNDHFKLRSEISYNKTQLDHFGKWVGADRTGIDAQRLRAHSGQAENLDIGMQLEYFPLSIRAFSSHTGGWAPFISFGIHYTMSSPQQFTSFARAGAITDNNIFNPDNIFGPWIAAGGSDFPIRNDTVNAFSAVASIGTRYKITLLSDLMIDLRFQYFGNDWIDGLNHKLSSNKMNDALVWLNIGYIYYLD